MYNKRIGNYSHFTQHLMLKSSYYVKYSINKSDQEYHCLTI